MLTPKELAAAIGVSESSLRRWVDRGNLPISRTAGGHRRIPLAAAVRFIRETGATVVRPELLGFEEVPKTRRERPAAAATTTNRLASAQTPEGEALFRALEAGDREVARGLVVSAYLAGRSLPALLDGPVRTAMGRLGQLWSHDPRGILVEHRGTEICVAAVARLRELLPGVPAGQRPPLAIGGGPQGDPYQLPSLMASLVCADAGYRDVNFGPNTPIELLGEEAMERGARLVWLSFTAAAPDPKPLRAAVERLVARLASRRIELVTGGTHAAEVTPSGLPNCTRCESMAELAAFAKGLRSRESGAGAR